MSPLPPPKNYKLLSWFFGGFVVLFLLTPPIYYGLLKFHLDSLAPPSSARTADIGLPPGWRLPLPEELSNAWKKQHPKRYAEVVGDFDGDGKPDTARIVVHGEGKKFAIVTWWGDVQKKSPHVMLADQDMEMLEMMGIELHQPSPTQNHAIAYFQKGRGRSVFYWNKDANKFMQVAMEE